MASTALVKDLLWRVSVLMGDTAPQFQRFTEREMVQALVDGQTAIAKYLPSATARTDAIKLVAGTRQSIENIPGVSIVPGDGVQVTTPLYGIQLLGVVRNMGDDGTTPGPAINRCERQDLDNFDPLWHQRTGPAVENYTYDERMPTRFYVIPAPAALPAFVQIEWSVLPLPIAPGGAPGSEIYSFPGGSVATITIADKFVDDLMCYILARAQLKDSKFADATKTTIYSALFINSINAQVRALTGSSPNIQSLPGVQTQA